MRYEGKMYRPPSESDAFIVQATIGCSWNACTYCDMYRDKTFRIRELSQTLEDLDTAAAVAGDRIEQRCPLRCGTHRPGQQCDLRGQVVGAELAGAGKCSQHRRNGACMLRGQNLGRGEQSALVACIDDLQHGAQGDDGLAGADLTLQ